MVVDTQTLAKQAIQAALNQDWETAMKINEDILTNQPTDTATMNRLAFALMQLGKLDKARSTYKQVLKIDQYNPIANKSLSRLTKIKGKPLQASSLKPKMFSSFLEEPGKTKTVSLLRPADTSILVQLTPGTPVNLVVKKKRISVETDTKKYIGCLPDDLGFRLISLIKAGYVYESFIKSSLEKSVTIFIKEVARSGKVKNLPSFPNSNGHGSSTLSAKFDPIEEVPIDVTPTGEEDEFEA